jgi:hypothetical protein
MRLSDARVRQPKTKAVYPDHRSPPWLTEDATRDRSNRLLDGRAPPIIQHVKVREFLFRESRRYLDAGAVSLYDQAPS